MKGCRTIEAHGPPALSVLESLRNSIMFFPRIRVPRNFHRPRSALITSIAHQTNDHANVNTQQKQEYEPAVLPLTSSSPFSAPRFVPRSTLAKMRDQGNPHPDFDWVNKTRQPLFWEPRQVKPVVAKLIAMHAALDNTADPNMIDREPDAPRDRGRPLHCAIAAGRTLSRKQGVVSPWTATRGKPPVVELLLEGGAAVAAIADRGGRG